MPGSGGSKILENQKNIDPGMERMTLCFNATDDELCHASLRHRAAELFGQVVESLLSNIKSLLRYIALGIIPFFFASHCTMLTTAHQAVRHEEIKDRQNSHARQKKA